MSILKYELNVKNIIVLYNRIYLSGQFGSLWRDFKGNNLC